MKNKNSPLAIGMFDSGLGGLTVMRQLMTLLPKESIIYLGDTARLPYGEKSPETIIQYCIENTHFLLQQKIKMLVVACNTASAHALDTLQALFSIPIIGVVKAGVRKLIQVTKNQKVAILATRGTIKSQIYPKEILKHHPHCQVTSIACPLFVPLVEEQLFDHPATRLVVREYLKPLKGKDIDTLMLGCTHYPLLQKLFEQELGNSISIVDSASACAEEIKEILELHHMLCKTEEKSTHQYFVSDDPEKFQKLGQDFLGCPIPQVKRLH